MVRYTSQVVAVGLFLCIAVPARGEEKPAAVEKAPRYKLHVGQELNYAGTSEFDYEGGSFRYKNSWKLLVVRQNTDGGWRLLVRNGMAYARTSKDADGDAAEPTFNPERVTVAWCDLAPDGRVAANPTLGVMLDVRKILPRLPADAQQDTWEAEDAATATRHSYSVLPAADGDAKHLRFVAEEQGPFNIVYVSASKETFSLDTERGLVDRIDSENTQGYGFKGKGQGETTLTSSENRDPNWCTAVAVEMNDYFAVKREYDELVDRAGKDPARTARLLASAKTNLDDLRKTVTTKVIQDQLDEDISNHADMIKYTEDSARRFASVLGQQSAPWETTDFDGSARSIEACRGKVVVLDFWYRGCGWCIRAMPQVKQIATHYRGQPVEIFGMNTDREEADARFVIEKLALNYPNLKAEGLPEKYGVQGFPTLVIIDQMGVVRDFHVGYSPMLAESVIASVDKLLADSPAAK